MDYVGNIKSAKNVEICIPIFAGDTMTKTSILFIQDSIPHCENNQRLAGIIRYPNAILASQSPDMNLIEHVCPVLDRVLQQRHQNPAFRAELLEYLRS